MLLPLLLVCAQDASSAPADVELGETVITAPRAGATVTTSPATSIVIEAEALVATGERGLAQAIARASGVWLQETNLGGGAPVVRGLLGGHVLVVVDGVRLNDSTTRIGPNQSLNQIDPAIVERVEILRGPGAVLYGSDAIGGVISVWTKRRRAATQDPQEYLRPYQGEANAQYDSALQGSRLSLNGSAARGDHGVLGVASGFDWDGLKGSEGDEVPNTGYNGHAWFGSYEYALGNRRTLRFSGRVNRDFNVPRTDKMNVGYGQSVPTHTDWRYSLQDRRGWLLSFTDQDPGDLADRMQLRLNLHTYEEERDLQRTGESRTLYERDEVVTVGLGVDWQKAVGAEHLLTWGLDASHDEVDSLREESDGGVTSEVPAAFAPDARYSRFGVFVRDEVLAFDPWFLTLGVRWSAFDFRFGQTPGFQSTSDHFSALTAAVEVARELGDGWNLTAGLSQGFRAPNLDDLANNGSFASGVEVANPDLDPEESLTLEAAVDVSRPAWRGSLGVFGTHIEDFIGRVLLDAGDPNEDGDEIYRRENTGEVDLVGAELFLWRRLGDEDSAYAADAGIAWVRGRQDDPSLGSGTVPARRVPPLHGHLGLNYEPAEPEWFYLPNARFTLVWADGQDRLHPQDVSDPRIDPGGTAGWVTYNLDVWGEFNRDASWRIGILNLTDTSYRVHGSGFDAPGRRLVVSLHLEF